MQRYKLTVEYNGTPYVGWQRQDNGLSVQQCIEEAIYKFCQTAVTLCVAGRTDAGVHATGQVCHADLPVDLDADKVRKAINFYLEEQLISIVDARKVDSDFSARFSATKRYYMYRIINRPAKLAIEKGLAWHIPIPLDTKAMQEGANYLIGYHDFSTFRASQCQANSPMRTLDTIQIVKDEKDIRIYLEALSFLHHQVRNIVGTLYFVGIGKWTPEDINKALKAKDRTKGGQTAPAEGLYLTQVDYGNKSD
jgi:tRNA pseudouridine38-40 synthase